jgi:F-type H+-transporting ATPase subunit alpha
MDKIAATGAWDDEIEGALKDSLSEYTKRFTKNA